MREPLLTEEARNDLAEIWETIAGARDERTANRMNQRILASCRSKAQFPETGRLREEIALGLRSALVAHTWSSSAPKVRRSSSSGFCMVAATSSKPWVNRADSIREDAGKRYGS